MVAHELPQVRILLETINPLDLTPEDLEELAGELTHACSRFDCEVAYDEQYGAGVTWHEVLRIWLPNAEFIKDSAYTLLLTSCVSYMRKRFSRKHGARRPKSIIFHDSETGKEIQITVLDSADAEPHSQPLETVPRKRPQGRHRRSG